MANKSPSGYLRRASDLAPIKDLAGIIATFQSEWMPLADAGDSLGLAVKCVNVGGTGASIVPTLELSPDGGTTAFPFPEAYASETQAALADVADDDATHLAFAYWPQPLPGLAGWSWRVVFTVSGTPGTNTLTAIRTHRSDGEDNF